MSTGVGLSVAVAGCLSFDDESRVGDGNADGANEPDEPERVEMSVGRPITETTSDSIIATVPVSNDGNVQATTEFRTTLYLDREEHDSKTSTVTLEPGEEQDEQVEFGLSGLEIAIGGYDTYDVDVDVIDEYQ